MSYSRSTNWRNQECLVFLDFHVYIEYRTQMIRDFALNCAAPLKVQFPDKVVTWLFQYFFQVVTRGGQAGRAIRTNV